MKKFRIIFAVIALVAIFAAPAYADFFYLRKDTDTTVKVSPYLYPNIGMFDYPKDLTLNSTADTPAFCGTYTIVTDQGAAEYMIATNWDATEDAQVGSLFAYQGFGWGMPSSDTNYYRLDSIKIPGSGKTPSSVACLGTLLYLANRGEEKTECGSVTVHNTQDPETPFAFIKEIVFDKETLPEYLKDGDITHADRIFAYNSQIYVLLSVENNGTWKHSILVTLNASTEITQVVELDTIADGYATLVPFVDLSGYMLLAAGNTIEKVVLEDPEKSKVLVNEGIVMEGWTGHFSHIARDANDNTYVMCQSSDTENVTTLVYKVSSTTLDAMEGGPLPTDNKILSAQGQLGDPFVLGDVVYTSDIWIYLGEQNILYRYTSGSQNGSQYVVLGGDGYIIGDPVMAANMNNPSDTQIPDSGGGCNAGATAAMLAFCAVPFFFRKKH